MDGVHDLGGRDGFGAIPYKDDDQPFHSAWERRAFGVAQSSGGGADWTIDWFRFCRELIPPADYLARPYFDHWMAILAAQLIDAGYLTLEELKSGKSAFKPVPGFGTATAAEARAFVRKPISFLMPEEVPARFAAGDKVRAKRFGNTGHTRLPGYARGRAGTLISHHGTHVLPDASARGEHRGAHLYTVRFAASELWPEARGRTDQVHVDLWEDYLEPA